MKFWAVFWSLFIASPAFSFERIITLTPEIGEWAALILGKESAKKKMVGVSDFTDEPKHLKTIPAVGSYAALRVEQILALKPDLIVASSENNRGDQIERLKQLNLNVHVLPKVELEAASEWIEKLGKILNEPPAARRLSKEWSQQYLAIKKSDRQKIKVFVEVQHQPLMSIGSESFLTEALGIIGMQNIFKHLNAGYPKVSTEAVVRENPDVILIMDQTRDRKGAEASRKDWKRFPRLKAVRGGKIEIISGNDFARISLRLLNGLKALESKYVEHRP